MKTSRITPVLGLIISLLLLTSVSAGENQEGKSKDKAVVLIPLPFEQETDSYSILQKNDVLWFLLYADKGETFTFEFTEALGKGVLTAGFYGSDSENPETEYTKRLSNGTNFIIPFSAKDQGNYYIRLTVNEGGSWKGTLKYYIGKPPQS